MNLIGRGDAPPTPEAEVELPSSPEAPERFTLGDAPFWPVDRLLEPDAWAGHIPFAFWIVEALRPRLLVELGTHSGNSYFAFAQAVHRLGLGTACFAIDTWLGDPHAGHYGEEVFQELSRYHDTRYSAFSRLVRSTFDEAVQHFPDASVDLLHVDGLHTYEAVARDFETWRPKLSERAVVLFHDINVRERDFGVWRLWDELRRGHPHFEFLHAHGLGVLGVGSDLPAAVTALWPTTGPANRVGRIRDAFARLGSSAVERMHFQARVEALQDEINRLAETVRTGSQEMAARDELIRWGATERASLEEAAQGRDQARVSEINGLQRHIEEQRGLINDFQHEIARLRTLRAADRQELVGVQEQLHRAEREWAETSAQAAVLRAETSAEAAVLRAELWALHQSTSLRLTAPLRRAAGWYRTAVAWARRVARSP